MGGERKVKDERRRARMTHHSFLMLAVIILVTYSSHYIRLVLVPPPLARSILPLTAFGVSREANGMRRDVRQTRRTRGSTCQGSAIKVHPTSVLSPYGLGSPLLSPVTLLSSPSRSSRVTEGNGHGSNGALRAVWRG